MASGFSEFGLDVALEQGVLNAGVQEPSAVQKEAIPHVLDGRDVLVRARTGSGKTLAYLIPILQRVLVTKAAEEEDGMGGGGVKALVLVPSRELCKQVTGVANTLTSECGSRISVVHVGTEDKATSARIQASLPDVLVGTPKRVAGLAPQLGLADSLLVVVVDEADLVLSYGYADDIQTLLGFFPRIVQTVLMSATLSDDVEKLQALLLKDPVVLRIGADADSAIDTPSLKQFYIYVDEQTKFLLLYTLLKLKIIRGKVLIFVNSIDKCYRTKLFLDQFSLKSAVLNSELPLNSRYSIVTQFGKGVFDYLIATDAAVDSKVVQDDVFIDSSDDDDEDDEVSESDSENDDDDYSGESDDDDDQEEEQRVTKKAKKLDAKAKARAKAEKARQRKKSQLDEDEIGVARGIDFKYVDTVINFDFPESIEAYVHRIGRTARGGASGSSLSMVKPSEKPLLTRLQAQTSESSAAASAAAAASGNGEEEEEAGEEGEGMEESKLGSATVDINISKYQFDVNRIRQFEYRVRDALSRISRRSIKDARLAEIRNEVLNSDKLKSHFEDNPTDLDALKHDIVLQPQQMKKSLQKVPAYLLSTTELRLLQKEADALASSRQKKVRKRKSNRNRNPLKRRRGRANNKRRKR